MADKNIVIIDVRTIAEFQQGHAKDAVHIDFYSPTFPDEIKKLDTSKTYHVYCRSGNRSGQAEVLMKQLGFQRVTNIGGLEQASQMYPFEEAD